MKTRADGTRRYMDSGEYEGEYSPSRVSTVPVLLSETLGLTLRQLAKRHRREQALREMNLQMAELHARRAFHQDPTHNNLTTWCDAKERLNHYQERR